NRQLRYRLTLGLLMHLEIIQLPCHRSDEQLIRGFVALFTVTQYRRTERLRAGPRRTCSTCHRCAAPSDTHRNSWISFVIHDKSRRFSYHVVLQRIWRSARSDRPLRNEGRLISWVERTFSRPSWRA